MSRLNVLGKKAVPLEEMIGISTISFGGVSAAQAIKAVANGGFKTIELLMNVNSFAAIGYPQPLPGACWLYPRNVGREERKQLRIKLKQFTFKTAHVQIFDANIASINPGIRAESVRQYLECVELARDLGIGLITFHAGRYARNGYPEIGLEETIRFNREFIKQAMEYAERYDMFMGFECLGSECLRLIELVKDAGRNRFGIHIDVMWATAAIGRAGLLQAIKSGKDHIVEVHVHGGLYRAMGAAGHMPLRVNNMVDFQSVVPKIRATGFKGPFIFEITSSDDIDTVIHDCQDSKKRLLDYWSGGRG